MSKALLVGDNSPFSHFLRHSLPRQFPDLEIIEVTSETQARDLIESFSPDLVFLDAHLTDGNSFELSKEIKTSTSDAIIIILANYYIHEYKTMGEDYGADFFLSKEQPLNFILNFIAELIVIALLQPKNMIKTFVI